MSQTIAGALVGGALGAFGKKVEIPDLPALNPLDSAKQATDINLATLPGNEALASQTNAFNQSQLDQLIEKALPGGSSQIKKNILSELQGQLPPDVMAAIARSAAAKSAAGGFAGSGFGRALEAQDIGLTSLQLTGRGLDAAQRWLAQSTAPLLDVSKSFFSPQQLLSFNTSERNLQYQNQLLKNQVAAAPDPNMVQLAQGFDNFFKTWSSIGTMGLGGMGGGGGLGGFGGGGGGGGGGALTSVPADSFDPHWSTDGQMTYNIRPGDSPPMGYTTPQGWDSPGQWGDW